ncbi:D-alanine--D-alanine ligase [Salinibius halmophilus]|uniref:D-alanine--D-alanine ligase n=1 Tax=Salinibius halmophilus TaxID=1853216 RepID=UPI000E664381|nr:D-alanine--D-alanine ligase [Salinibius halmophilus]
MSQLSIAVLYGGTSAERAVSLQSGEAVAEGLLAAGHKVELIDTQAPFISRLLNESFDLAFIALHGRGGEDGVIQGLLESIKLPYTGSGVAASALAMDKHCSKVVMAAAGVPVAPSITLNADDVVAPHEIAAELGLPLFVKPVREGSSVGMSKVNQAQDLVQAVSLAREFDQQVLVEAFLAGREYSVPILAGRALPVIGLQPATEFYDYAAKYERDDTTYALPSGLSQADEVKAQRIAEQAAHALGCRGWCRVDVMADAQGELFVLEVNTSPGMTSHSLVPMAAKAEGKSFSELVDHIAHLALETA